MRHYMEFEIDFCKHCGKSMFDIVDKDVQECSGSEGVIHIDYMRAKKLFEELIAKACMVSPMRIKLS